MSVIKILKSFRNVAMVGVSANPEKPSNIVFTYLTAHGYNVIPVNPTIDEVLWQEMLCQPECYPRKGGGGGYLPSFRGCPADCG